METRLKTNTNKMYAFELAKNNLQTRVDEAELKVRDLKEVGKEQSEQIHLVAKHEHGRERSWIEEIEKNAELLKMLEAADHAVLNTETSKLFGM